MSKRLRRPMDDTRATWVKGYEISSQVITIALELVLPALLGFFVDRRIGIFPVITIVGLAFGLAVGTLHFVYFAKTLSHTPKGSSRSQQEPTDHPNR